MRQLAILTFISLDGVMQAPSVAEEDRSGGFSQGGWARAYWDDVMPQVMREAMAEPYDLLLGRTTYQIFASAFAHADDPVAQKLTEANKYVVSSSLKALEWKNSHLIEGNIAAEVSRLKSQPGPLLQVHGSWQLVQTLLKQRLIDEFRLWTFPVVLGAGKRLFADGSVPATLQLTQSASCASGAMMTFYRPLDNGRTS